MSERTPPSATPSQPGSTTPGDALVLRLRWTAAEAPDADALLALLGQHLWPQGRPMDAPLDLLALTGDARPVLLLLPGEAADGVPSGWAWVSQIDGLPAAWLRLQEEGREVALQLPPTLAGRPAALKALADWLRLLRLAWPPSRAEVSRALRPSLDPEAILDPQQVEEVVTALSHRIFAAACAQVKGEPPGPVGQQRVDWTIALFLRVALRLRGAPNRTRATQWAIGEAVGDLPLAQGHSTDTYSMRISHLAIGMAQPAGEAFFKATLLGAEKVSLFRELVALRWGPGETPRLNCSVKKDVSLERLAAQESERCFYTIGDDSDLLFQFTTYDPQVEVKGGMARLLGWLRRHLPQSTAEVGVLSLTATTPRTAGPRLLPALVTPDLGLYLKGPWHDRFQSRRLITHGPWLVHALPGDATLVQFHATDCTAREANRQSRASQAWMAASLVPAEPALPADLPVSYDAEGELLWLDARGRSPTIAELGHLVGLARTRTAGPVSRLAALFPSEAAAAALGAALWLREIEAWVDQPAGWRRVEGDASLAPPPPDWVTAERAAQVAGGA